MLSALLWRGNPSIIFDPVLDGRLELCLTEELLSELADVLRRPRIAKHVAERRLDVRWSCDFIRERSFIIAAAVPLDVPELRDRNDLPVLTAAKASTADLIITGDKDLLSLESFARIPIVEPAEAVKLLSL